MSDQELALIAETVDAILTRGTAADSRSGPAQVDRVALERLSEAGMRRVALPESAGGSEGELGHLAVVLSRLAHHAADVPLLEDHLAAELLVHHGCDVPEGLLTIASRSDLVSEATDDGVRVSGRLSHVPWGRFASHVVAVAQSADGPAMVALSTKGAAVSTGLNVADEPRDSLTYDAAVPIALVADDEALSRLRSRALIYRSLMLLGAGERALEMTTVYVTERTQFGRPLSQRQVVQHYAAEMFGAVTATRAACDAALASLVREDGPGTLAASLSTKIEADRMASLVARLAHQLHGAIGVTQEHPLHEVTTRLAAWRQDDLSETACALELSRLVPELGGPWNVLTYRGQA